MKSSACVEMMELWQPPRISLSEGLLCMESEADTSAELSAQLQDASGSPCSSDFEFLASFGAVVSERGGGCSPSLSMCCADKVFSNGRILPLDQILRSPEQKLKQLSISDGISSEVGPLSVSRSWTDVFKLKKSSYSHCSASAGSKEKRSAPAKSLWFLRRSRSTSDKDPEPNNLGDVDPWLGRSSSDSRMNRLARSSNSRRASAKAPVETFRPYTSHVISLRNDSSNGKVNLRSTSDLSAMAKRKSNGVRINVSSPMRNSGKRRANESEGRSSGIAKRLDSGTAEKPSEGRSSGIGKRMDGGTAEKPSVSRRSFKASNAGSDIAHNRKEMARLKIMQKLRDGSAGSYQVAPVLHMQMCMSHSFITSKVSRARLGHLCHLNFLKKEKSQKQSLSAAAALVSIS